MPIPSDVNNANYGRKPYVTSDKGGQQELMRRPSRRSLLDQRLAKKSQFDKPYNEDSYPEMEHFQPPPMRPFDDRVFPSFTGPVPTDVRDIEIPPSDISAGGAGQPTPLSGGNNEWYSSGTGGVPCIVTVNGPYQCSKIPADRFHVAHIFFLLFNLNYMSIADFIKNTRIYHKGKRITDGKRIQIPGSGIDHISVAAPTEGWAIGDKLYVEVPDVNMQNFGMKLCSQSAVVHCFPDSCNCDAPPEGAFAIDDDSTPDTIVAGSSIDVYVTGGCAPFTYVVSETGYTWNSNGSTTLESDNRNEQLDCAAGTCGVDYAPRTNVTVTDYCGTEVSMGLRNTNGGWGAALTVCGSGADSTYVQGSVIEGYYRYTAHVEGTVERSTDDCEVGDEDRNWGSDYVCMGYRNDLFDDPVNGFATSPCQQTGTTICYAQQATGGFPGVACECGNNCKWVLIHKVVRHTWVC